jgi:hypothetical protein
MWNVLERGEVCNVCRWRNLRERDYWIPNVRWENNISRMEAIPLCLLLNTSKLLLFSLTQHRFILNQIVALQSE